MENENIAPTIDGQGESTPPQVSFNDKGELEFTPSGFATFKELLREGVTDNTVRPQAEAIDEKEDKPEEKNPVPENETEDKGTPPPSKKHKIKIDGQEMEVSDDELRSLAQQGYKFTQKMQQLAAERDALAPYQGIIKLLQTNPEFGKHIASFGQQRQEPKKPPQFDDPIEELKWQIKQETLEEARKELQQTLQQSVVPMQRQQILDQVRQQVMADPDYKEVQQQLLDYVNSLPPTLQKATYMQLDQDPKAYIEAFNHFKSALKSRKTTTPSNNQEGASPSVKPEPVKTRERAPILESSNSAPSEPSAKARAALISKAKARALREGSLEALQEYIELGGFIDHLK